MSGLVTIRIREDGGIVAEETVVSDYREIESITKGMKILFRKVELEIVFDPPIQFREAPQQQEQEIENG